MVWLTVYLDVECLLGNWRDTVVCFAHVFPHVFSADLSNIKYRSYLVGNCKEVSMIQVRRGKYKVNMNVDVVKLTTPRPFGNGVAVDAVPTDHGPGFTVSCARQLQVVSFPTQHLFKICPQLILTFTI